MNLNWRSILFVPGNRPERFAKAFAAGADAVCLDLEDAVKAADKPAARQQTMAALSQPPEMPAAVRINAANVGWYEDDLSAVQQLPQQILAMLPKANLASVKQTAEQLPDRGLIAVLEDPLGIEEAYDIARQDAVVGLVLGAADLAAQLGARMEWEPLLYARSRMLMAAVSAGCLAMDVPSLELKDPAVVEAETRRVRALGYSCKAAIHPMQIEPIHLSLMPSDSEIDEARAMLAAYRDAGGGALAFNGVMLDEPVLIAARRTLAMAGQDV